MKKLKDENKTLTDYFAFSDNIATNYLLIVGLLADGIGILALKYLIPKNDYLTITIKFGIRFTDPYHFTIFATNKENQDKMLEIAEKINIDKDYKVLNFQKILK